MKIKVEKPAEDFLNNLGIKKWPVWTKEKSRFNWVYDTKEICYILEGKVKVIAKDGETVEFGKGDLVTFPKGLECIWEIQENVKKHYRFE